MTAVLLGASTLVYFLARSSGESASTSLVDERSSSADPRTASGADFKPNIAVLRTARDSPHRELQSNDLRLRDPRNPGPQIESTVPLALPRAFVVEIAERPRQEPPPLVLDHEVLRSAFVPR